MQVIVRRACKAAEAQLAQVPTATAPRQRLLPQRRQLQTTVKSGAPVKTAARSKTVVSWQGNPMPDTRKDPRYAAARRAFTCKPTASKRGSYVVDFRPCVPSSASGIAPPVPSAQAAVQDAAANPEFAMSHAIHTSGHQLTPIACSTGVASLAVSCCMIQLLSGMVCILVFIAQSLLHNRSFWHYCSFTRALWKHCCISNIIFSQTILVLLLLE